MQHKIKEKYEKNKQTFGWTQYHPSASKTRSSRITQKAINNAALEFLVKVGTKSGSFNND